MGKKRIKHLGRKSARNRKIKRVSTKLGLFIGCLTSIVMLYIITKNIEELYKSKNIENSTIEYYMDIADEVGDKETQLNWKELFAIENTMNNGDLTNIRKKDTLDIAKNFLTYRTDKNGEKTRAVKSFEEVLKKVQFDKKQVQEANKYLNSLEYTFLGNKKIDKNDERIIFIKSIQNEAIKSYEEYGVLPSVTVGQAILESGWGKSGLSIKSNNLFGIKADSRWSGDSVEVSTSENYNDKIVAKFRKYGSVDESIRDHGKFLWENKRYKENGLFNAKHYTTQAQALEDAGYSTKENENGEKVYADILIEVIKSYNLQLLDHEVQTLK